LVRGLREGINGRNRWKGLRGEIKGRDERMYKVKGLKEGRKESLS